MNILDAKNIVVGVTGGIAAYKSCDLVRQLSKAGASVQVVMTRNAQEFVTPLTLQTLSGRKVAVSSYDPEWESEIGHISIADDADIIIVAPATANFIGKLASGLADGLLYTIILATKAPVVLCPSMNVNMYENPIVQDNLEKLKKYGFILMEPVEGNLACGWEGKGRLPEVSDIVEEIEYRLTDKDMSGERVLVTAGSTREFIDPVRFISNPSSGKMGYALARAAQRRGAQVVLISGKSSLTPPKGIRVVNVVSSEEMYNSVMEHADWSTIVIKAAAVGDYAADKISKGKIKKDGKDKNLKLKRTTDILEELGKDKNGRLVVGFAAETENLVKNARDKLKRKNADLIIANDVLAPGAGFESDTNIVMMIYGKGKADKLPRMSKEDLAHIILDKIVELKTSA